MKTRLYSILCLLLAVGFNLMADEINVTKSSDLPTAVTNAKDGDVLLLASGTYTNAFKFPNGKTITLKAAPDLETAPILTSFEVNGNGMTEANGGLIFDGLDIFLNRNTGGCFIYLNKNYGSIKIISFQNCTMRGVGRCLIRTELDNAADYTIDKISFDNCIIKDFLGNDYNYIAPKHVVKEVSVKNSTLYKYVAESFFIANTADTSVDFNFTFENNTVYKWAKDSNRALCKVTNKYSANSIYTFKNNIITEPGISDVLPKVIDTNSGTVIGQNNLIVNYGGYNGGTQTINDLTLEDLELTNIGFPDPENGDFTILSSSPLATASTTEGIIGDPRWLKLVSKPVDLTTAVFPAEAGAVTPSATYEEGQSITVSATKNYGYKFKEWQINNEAVSTENPYTFVINDDTEITAIFETVSTYSLTINKIGDGANWGKVSLNPEPINGVYEENTTVIVTIIPNSVTSFVYWDNESDDLSRTIEMTDNTTITADFDWIPFIVGWDFNPTDPRGDRPGDYYVDENNKGVMKLYKSGNEGGGTTNWTINTKTWDGVTLDGARKWSPAADVSDPRYFRAEFSAQGYTNGEEETFVYKNIQVKSYIGIDNVCAHKRQKMQYSTDAGITYEDLAIIDMTDFYNSKWVECNATLPELTEEEKANICIRWIGDTTSDLFGDPGTGTEGFYLANVFVYGELKKKDTETSISTGEINKINYTVQSGKLNLYQLTSGSLVTLYDITGRKLFSEYASSTDMSVPVSGICIVQITSPTGIKTIKVATK